MRWHACGTKILLIVEYYKVPMFQTGYISVPCMHNLFPFDDEMFPLQTHPCLTNFVSFLPLIRLTGARLCKYSMAFQSLIIMAHIIYSILQKEKVSQGARSTAFLLQLQIDVSSRLP
jgi:hypothetical protein